ncbi:MAG: hypothetical protein ACKV1O_16080 [Saprospiraceae bacterium]
MKVHVSMQFGCVLALIAAAFDMGIAQPTHAPASGKAPLVQLYDLRHEPAASAVAAGLSASRQSVVVVLVRGGDKTLIDEVEGNMRALMLNKFERIGLILGSNFSNEYDPVISIFSNGQVYAVIEEAKADADTKLSLFKLVRDAYQEHITPLLRKQDNGNN